MFTFVIIIHGVTCVLLILVILMQSGRGGGLTESFTAAESIFGTKTNSFMVRTTAVLAIIFLFTCIGLAVLSTSRSRSLVEVSQSEAEPTTQKDIVPEEKPQQTK